MVIYDLPPPLDLIILIPQFLSLAGFLWAVRYFSVQEFLGISQIFRWKHNEYDINELDEKLTLKIEGPYKFCRHPLYLFLILFLVFRPEMDLFYLTILICIIVYLYVGSIYEEKRLTEKFGEEYINYRNSVPRIIPIKFTRFKH
jgi:protein-S-isoprenylcysteine O-methyltransferase Ste14